MLALSKSNVLALSKTNVLRMKLSDNFILQVEKKMSSPVRNLVIDIKQRLHFEFF